MVWVVICVALMAFAYYAFRKGDFFAIGGCVICVVAGVLFRLIAGV